MNAQQLSYFSSKLLALKEAAFCQIHATHKNLAERPQRNNETGQSQNAKEAHIAQRTAEQEIKKLRKIDAALKRIHTGDYGYCLISGEPIGITHLLKHPTTEYTMSIKHQKEREAICGKHSEYNTDHDPIF